MDQEKKNEVFIEILNSSEVNWISVVTFVMLHTNSNNKYKKITTHERILAIMTGIFLY